MPDSIYTNIGLLIWSRLFCIIDHRSTPANCCSRNNLHTFTQLIYKILLLNILFVQIQYHALDFKDLTNLFDIRSHIHLFSFKICCQGQYFLQGESDVRKTNQKNKQQLLFRFCRRVCENMTEMEWLNELFMFIELRQNHVRVEQTHDHIDHYVIRRTYCSE